MQKFRYQVIFQNDECVNENIVFVGEIISPLITLINDCKGHIIDIGTFSIINVVYEPLKEEKNEA